MNAELNEFESRIEHQEDVFSKFKKEIRDEIRQQQVSSQDKNKQDGVNQVNLSQK